MINKLVAAVVLLGAESAALAHPGHGAPHSDSEHLVWIAAVLAFAVAYVVTTRSHRDVTGGAAREDRL